MNTEYLVEFLAFSKTLNYAKTAKDLYISQPTLIQHIAKLEEEIGTELVLHRGKARKPSLTPAGNVLAYSAKEVLDACDKVAESCRAAAAKEASCIYVRDDRQNIGIHPAFFDSLKDPESKVSPIRFKNSLKYAERTLLETLEGEDPVDVSFGVFYKGKGINEFMEGAGDAYRFVALLPEECLVLVAADHPLASRESVSVKDLAGHRLMFCEYRPWSTFFETLIDDLKEQLPDLRVGYFAPNSTQDPLVISHDNVRIYPATHAETATSYWAGSIVALHLDDCEAYSVPVAICRKDNPKAIVHELFERLASNAE